MKAIMVGVDGSPQAEVAVQHAIEIAELADAGVVAVASVFGDFDGEAEAYGHDVQTREGLEHLPTAAVNWFREALEECGEACAVADVEFTARLLAGRPDRVLVEEAQSVDMVVVGATGRGGKNSLFGQTASRVMRNCIKPVLVTRERPVNIERIMVGYDGSPASGHALEWAADLAAAGGWKLAIVTGAVPESELAEGADYAAKLAATRGVEAEVFLVTGDAPSVIFNQAKKWDPQMIAVGGPQRGALSGFFLGEAWPEIVEQAEVPVLRWR
ncbi:MAG: universal stress protein [Armatimonadota bacterium]|jgi:nucleotide-binding universal stress UspA family protein